MPHRQIAAPQFKLIRSSYQIRKDLPRNSRNKNVDVILSLNRFSQTQQISEMIIRSHRFSRCSPFGRCLSRTFQRRNDEFSGIEQNQNMRSLLFFTILHTQKSTGVRLAHLQLKALVLLNSPQTYDFLRHETFLLREYAFLDSAMVFFCDEARSMLP
ncbi:MAG: hypothetical protein GY820_47715 [Gammaproteobacteria bacterium]|nr:hypothetical protein [Gammaproteobacteria bacterium]